MLTEDKNHLKPLGDPPQGTVQGMVDALKDANWQVRRATVDALARQGSQEAVTAILGALRREGHNISVLNSALQVLILVNLDVLSPLQEFLADPDPETRQYAALALGELHDPRAVPVLLKTLGDHNANVRYHAIEALGKIRTPEAVEALCDIAQSGDFFLAFPALDALRLIGDSRAVDRIMDLLQDDLLREPVVEALGEMGDDAVAVPLARLLNDPEGPILSVARALTGLYDRYERLYQEGPHIADLARAVITETGQQNLVDSLGQAGAEDFRPLALVLGWLEGLEATRVLVRLLGYPGARQEVVDALVRHGHRVTELLVDQLQVEDAEIRKAAIIALGRIGDGRAVPPLVKVLESDPEMVTVAAGALAKIGDRQAFEPLLDLLGHPQAAVRQAAIGALNSLGHPQMELRMRELMGHPDHLVRTSAVTIAGYFGYSSCVELLLGCCRDEHEGVRTAAVEYIAYLENPRVAPTLAAALAQDTPRVRAAAVRALAFVDPKTSWPLLLDGLRDQDSWVRYFSARSVGRHSLPEAIDPLTELIQSDPAPQVRIAAVEALGKIGGVKSVAILTPLAEDQDPDLARAALATLGLIGHPQAMTSLLDTLLSPDPWRRREVVLALKERGGLEAVRELHRTAAEDHDPQVNQAAIEGLAHMGTPEAIGCLVALTAIPARREIAVAALSTLDGHRIPAIAQGLTHDDPAVRRAVVEVLARLKRPEATREILQALQDGDHQVRLEAVKALKHLKNPGVCKALAHLASTDADGEVRRAAQSALR